jgi:hypothetical protein
MLLRDMGDLAQANIAASSHAEEDAAEEAAIAFRRLHVLSKHGYSPSFKGSKWPTVLELYHASNPDGPNYNPNAKFYYLMLCPNGLIVPSVYCDAPRIEPHDESAFLDFVSKLPQITFWHRARAVWTALFGG